MDIETINVITKVAACVCGRDGVISQIEEESIFETIIAQFPSCTLEQFNQAIDDFFDENLQLEEYLEKISGSQIKSFTIHLCEVSASADGLDIKENIALHKVKLILGEVL
ncbi:MAG: hypothetical protein ABJH06_09405 [Paraglaciecola sp.]|uniref:hypothetical protein n=1 Tax=Paraglaciecola sp. TaxID=1920173 RepID=UPI003297C41F